ncbi:MAG: 50S ribosomal protein L10 [Verrucomicrobia bacterium]|nr:50S ribosomal protein L10 [Verrucomicrobiota bacterium]
MRKEKQLLLNEILEKIDASKAMIITRYDALPPNKSWILRDLLSKTGSHFEVVRKRVFMKAAEKSGLKLDKDVLKGNVGVVFVGETDAMPSAKVVFKFSEENSKILEVLCGKIDGVMMPGSEVEMLSKLPGIDEMRAELIGLLIAPMAQMLSVLEAVMAEPISILEQKSKQEEEV